MNTTVQGPERVIVFLIDGLHWKAPEKLKMPFFNALAQKGTFVQRSTMILPHHPTVGEYGQLHSSSFPNPVLQSGTIFIRPETRMLQEMFSPDESSLFIANTKAYLSVSRGFSINVHHPGLSDKEVVDESIKLLKDYPVKYARIHLQSPGNEGRYLSYTSPDKPYFRNIWGEGSPYMKCVEEADILLGNFIAYLKESGKWDSTLLIVTSDHGQSEKGWHPIIEEDSVVTPFVISGPGIATGRILPYFEHTDLSPTIAGLMGIDPPDTGGGSGRFIREVLATEDISSFTHPRYIETLNRQLNEYNALRARIMIAGERDSYYSSLISYMENELLTPEPFYHQDRFLEWYRAGNIAHLLDNNRQLLLQMKHELSGFREK